MHASRLGLLFKMINNSAEGRQRLFYHSFFSPVAIDTLMMLL